MNKYWAEITNYLRKKVSFSALYEQKQLFIAALILLVAVIYRAIGLSGGTALWLDEAMWASLYENKYWITPTRPIGYSLIYHQIVQINPTELWLRLPSFLAGVGTLLIIFLTSQRLFKSTLVALSVLFVASFHPWLISFSKEFKAYSLELFIHALILFQVVLYKLKATHLRLYFLLISSVVGFFFSTSLMFLYPALFLILLWHAYKNKDKKALFLILATILTLLLVIFYHYFNIWHERRSASERSEYWGSKYGLFCQDSAHICIAWTAEKFIELSYWIGKPYAAWQSGWLLGVLPQLLMAAAFAFGLIIMAIKRDFYFFLLFASPIFVVIIFNVLGYWPWGLFRTNLFLFIYFLFVSFYAWETCINFFQHRSTRSKMCVITVMILLLLARLPFPVDVYAYKVLGAGSNSEMPQLLNVLVQSSQKEGSNEKCQKGRIGVDGHSLGQIHYYLNIHPQWKKHFEQSFVIIPNREVSLDQSLHCGLLVVYHLNNDEIQEILEQEQLKTPDTASWAIISKRLRIEAVDESPNLKIKRFRGTRLIQLK
jgi:hypothetical protein